MRKSDIFWQTYLNLEREAIDLSKYIFFTDNKIINRDSGTVTQSCDTQLETFSPYIADLLIRCCVQIEAISKELYFDNGGTKSRGDRDIFFDEDCLKLIDRKWQTNKKVVMVTAPSFDFTKEENRILRPLKKAHKRQGTYWERAYQAVKHDRYSSLYKGNVKAFLHALAALYLLNIYYRNDSWTIKYCDISTIDFSLGSSIFSVKRPTSGQLWYGNNPEKSDSPFVVKYTDNDFRHIEDMQQEDNTALSDYWHNQPELKETEFLVYLTHEFNLAKSDPTHKVMGLQILSKYRLHKKLPSDLPFSERKAMLISSEEWKMVKQANSNLVDEDTISEETIEKEIEHLGNLSGTILEHRVRKLEWTIYATSKANCDIYIG